MRNGMLLLVAVIGLLSGCTTPDRNADWDPGQEYPDWAYDAPFYYEPEIEMEPQERVGEDIPIYYTRDDMFFVPHPGERQQDVQPRVSVWYSRDGGNCWSKGGYFGVDQTHFLFHGEEDGRYWIRFVGPGQGVAEVPPGQPHEIYVLDTHAPEIDVEVVPGIWEDEEKTIPHIFRVGDVVTVHWTVRDHYLQEDTISLGTCFARFPHNLVWSRFKEDLYPVGSMRVTIPPEAASQAGMRFRVEAHDKAGNIGLGMSDILMVATAGHTPPQPGMEDGAIPSPSPRDDTDQADPGNEDVPGDAPTPTETSSQASVSEHRVDGPAEDAVPRSAQAVQWKRKAPSPSKPKEIVIVPDEQPILQRIVVPDNIEPQPVQSKQQDLPLRLRVADATLPEPDTAPGPALMRPVQPQAPEEETLALTKPEPLAVNPPQEAPSDLLEPVRIAASPELFTPSTSEREAAMPSTRAETPATSTSAPVREKGRPVTVVMMKDTSSQKSAPSNEAAPTPVSTSKPSRSEDALPVDTPARDPMASSGPTVSHTDRPDVAREDGTSKKAASMAVARQLSEIPERVQMGWPAEGMTIRGGVSRLLNWLPDSAPAYKMIELEFTSDGGKHWLKVADGLRPGRASLWKVPEVNSQRCRLRIVGLDGQSGRTILLTGDLFEVSTASWGGGGLR